MALAPAPCFAADEPPDVSGIERRGRAAGESMSQVAEALAFVPRNVIDYAFRGTELAALLITERQLVPRFRDLLSQPNAELLFFPTLFAETGNPLSVGARMIFNSPHLATSQRVGFGGKHQVEAESRVVVKGRVGKLPSVLSLELYYLLQDNLEFHGIGLVPSSDSRNRFITGTDYTFGYYTERRTRALASGGIRLHDNVELLLSSSAYRRTLSNTNSREAESVDAVFEHNSVPGLAAPAGFVAYAELAARFDSRAIRTRPAPGWQLEAYAGGARGLATSNAAFVRVGARASVGMPIYRASNILAMRLAVDTITAAETRALSFAELVHFPEFRGYDTRRDEVGVLGSLDYTWVLTPALGARIFIDGVTVAPSLGDIGFEQLLKMRFAGGFGLDAFAGSSTIASIGMSASGDGLRLVASFSAPQRNGDRQHRD